MRKKCKWFVEDSRELVRVIECLVVNAKHPVVVHNGKRAVVFVESGSDSRGRIRIAVRENVNVYAAIKQVMDEGFTVTEPYEHCINDYFRIEVPEESRVDAKQKFIDKYPHNRYVREYGVKMAQLKRA